MKKHIFLKFLAVAIVSSLSFEINAAPTDTVNPSNKSYSSAVSFVKQSSKSDDLQFIQSLKEQAVQALDVLVSRLEELEPSVRSESFKTLSQIPEMLSMLTELSQKNGISSDALHKKLNNLSEIIKMTVERINS